MYCEEEKKDSMSSLPNPCHARFCNSACFPFSTNITTGAGDILELESGTYNLSFTIVINDLIIKAAKNADVTLLSVCYFIVVHKILFRASICKLWLSPGDCGSGRLKRMGIGRRGRGLGHSGLGHH